MAQYTFDTLLDFDIANIVLPSGYTKLNYIQSSGSQYVDTGIVPTPNTYFFIIANMSVACTLFGARAGSGASGFAVHSNPNQPLLFDYGNVRTNSSVIPTYNEWHSIVADANIFYLDDVEVGHTTKIETYNMNNRTSYFMALNNNGSLVGSTLKSALFEMSNENGHVKYIPCEYNGVVGVFDLISNTFISNSGTGTFTSGGTAPTYNFQNGDEIIISSTKTHYHYQDGDLVFWYQETPSLVFKGITFEQTDYWQKPEFVFRGFSFEITDKTGGSSMFHGMN